MKSNFLTQEYNFDKNAKIIISVGSLIPRKDPETILKAFVQADNENLILIFLGGVALLDALKRKYNSKNIYFVGHTDAVAEYLNLGDAFVSASKSEGLPLMIAEAAACGLHLICTEIPQFTEMLEGFDGKVDRFKVGDHSSLTGIFNERVSPKKNPSLRYLNKISSERMADKYIELYKNDTDWFNHQGQLVLDDVISDILFNY